MDDDALELEKARIEAEIKKRRRANAKALKEAEDLALIAAAEGRVSSDVEKKMLILPWKDQEKQKKRQRKTQVSHNFKLQTSDIVDNY